MRTKDFVTRAVALVAGKWAQDGVKTLLLLWLARVDQMGYGLFFFGVGVAYMSRALMATGLDQFTVRELVLDPEARTGVMGRMVRIKVFMSCLIIAGLLVFGLLKGWGRTQLVVVLIIALSEALETVANTFFSLYRAEGRQVQEALCSAMAHLIGAFYGVVAMFWGWGIVAFSFFLVFSGGLKIMLAVVVGARYGLPVQRDTSRVSWPRRKVNSLLLITGVSVSGSLYDHIQTFLLKQFRPLSEVALYGAAVEVVSGLAGLMANMVIGGVLYPSLTRAGKQGTEKMAQTVATYFWRFVVFGLGAAFFFVTLGGDLLIVLFGAKYVESVSLLYIIGPGILFSFMNNLLIYALLAAGREGLLFCFHLVPALMSIILGLILIPHMGPIGASWNLLACRVSLSLLILTKAQKDFALFSRKQFRLILPGVLILGVAGLGIWAAEMTGLDFRLVALAGLAGYALWAWRWARRLRRASSVEVAGHE